jgi:AcrR family transcriptional regulator
MMDPAPANRLWIRPRETQDTTLKHAKSKHAPVSRPAPVAPAARDQRPRLRLATNARREQLLDAAAQLIVEQGFLPLPLERLARMAKVSKALIYAYFPTQHDLFNALLTREIGTLKAAGLDAASRRKKLEDAAVDCTMIYFDHVAEHGPLLHILFSDLFMSGRIDRTLLRERDAIARRVARLARRVLGLTAKEAIASVNMVLAMPEEAGTLVFSKEADPGMVRELCRTLTLSALKALKATARGPR